MWFEIDKTVYTIDYLPFTIDHLSLKHYKMKKKLISFLVIGVLLLIAGILFYVYSQPSNKIMSDEEKQEKVTQLLGRKANLTNETPQGDTDFNGKYITFKYPARALEYNYRENSTSSNSASIEDFSFDITAPKLVFNLQVLTNTAKISSISSYPAVRLRETRLYEYKKANIDLDKITGLTYTKSENGPEKSGFWLSEGKIYSISITGSDINAMEDLFNSVVKSARLKY